MYVIGGKRATPHYLEVWYTEATESTPLAGFIPSITNGTAPLDVQFTDYSITGDSPITSYYWDFGDGTNSTLQNPAHTFTKLGGNRITETITDSVLRTSSYNATITVLPEPVVPSPPHASFLMDNAQGYSPLAVSFTDFSTGAIRQWYYNFGDGSGSQERNPVHTYSASESGLHLYTPSLTVTDTLGRVSTYTTNYGAVSFWGPDPKTPVADFTNTILSSPPNRPEVGLTDKSQRATSLTYYLGDGQTTTNRNPQYVYQKPAWYRITQSVSNAFGSREKFADVDFQTTPPDAKPSSIVSAGFAVDYYEGDSPLKVQFYDRSWGDIKSYLWEFSDGTTSTEKSPVHTFTVASNGLKVFQPRLTVTDQFGAISQYSASISVWGMYVSQTPTPTATGTATTIPSVTTTSTGTVTVTPTTTGSSDYRLIASQTEVMYNSVVGMAPDMSTIYKIYVTVTNPHDVPVPIDLTMEEIPIVKGYNEEYPINQPVSSDKTNIIQPHSSHTFTYSYIHKWRWTEQLTGPVASGVITTVGFGVDWLSFSWNFINFLNWDPDTIQFGVWSNRFSSVLGKFTVIAQIGDFVYGLIHPSEYQYVPHATNVEGLTSKNVYINVGLPKQTAYAASIASGYSAGALTLSGAATSWTGVGSTVFFAGEIFEIGAGVCFDNIANDPDPNYTDPVIIDTFIIPELEQANDSPIKTYVEQMAPLVDHSKALSKTYAKYLGAQQAEDPVWETKLLKDCYRYSSLIENDYDRINASTDPAIDYMEEQGFFPTTEDVAKAKNSIKTNGLPEFEKKYLRAWNFTDDDIDMMKNVSLNVPNSVVVNYNQSLYHLNNAAKNQISVLNEQFAEELGPNAPPLAEFNVSTTSGTAPLTVEFTDASLRNATMWHWDFGDNQTIATQNPDVFYTYMKPGNYTVSLTAMSPTGSDTRVKYNLISVGTDSRPVAGFTANATTGKTPVTVAFHDTSSNSPTSWLWEFGDNSMSREQNPVHEYDRGGNFTVTLNATNSYGSSVQTSPDYIQVIPNPSFPNFTATPRSGKVPLTVSFTDTSSGGTPTLWYWTFGDGADASVPNPVHTYTVAGNFSVDLETANGDGDSNRTVTDYITVLPLNPPGANFTASPLSGKAPLTVSFTDRSSNAPTNWSWTFGDGTTSTLQSPVHVYSTAGNFTVALNATNADGTGSLIRPGYISVSGAPPTSTPTTPPTTRPTTKPTTRPTKEPLSPMTAIIGVAGMGLVYAMRRKRQ